MIDSFHPFSGPHQGFQDALVRAVALVREVVLARPHSFVTSLWAAPGRLWL